MKNLLTLFLAISLTACGGGATEEGSEESTSGDTGPAVDPSTLTVEEQRTFAFTEIEEAYTLPEELEVETFEEISGDLQLSETNLEGTWVRLTKDKQCTPNMECSIMYSRHVHYINDYGVLSSSCGTENYIEEDDGSYRYSLSGGAHAWGPQNIDKLSHKHLRGYRHPNYRTVEAVTDYYKISDQLVDLGDINATLLVGEYETETNGDIDCYMEVAVATYDFETETTDHDVYVIAYAGVNGKVKVHLNSENETQYVAFAEHPTDGFMLEDESYPSSYTFETDLWNTSGSYSYTNYKRLTGNYTEVNGTFNFSISEFTAQP